MKTYFGINTEQYEDIIPLQEVCARLFIGCDLSGEMCEYLLEQVAIGGIPLNRFIGRTNLHINRLHKMRNTDSMALHRELSNRLTMWNESFGDLDEEDYAFLENRFSFTPDEFISDSGCACLSGNSILCNVRDLFNKAERFIKGQSEALLKLAPIFFYHYLSTKHGYINSNRGKVIITGPSGCGKTETVMTLGRLCGSLVICINSSQIVATGWRGDTVEDILKGLLRSGVKEEDIANAIFFIDEFDKVARFRINTLDSSSKDGSYDIMRDFMRITAKGYNFTLDIGADPITGKNRTYTIPNERMLFVFAGVFDGITDVVKRRLSGPKTIGFGPGSVEKISDSELAKNITAADLIEYGFMPELISRVGGNIVSFNPLSKEDYREILVNSENSEMKNVIQEARQFNTEIEFSDDAIDYISEKAYDSQLGVRSIDFMLQQILSDIQTEIMCIDGRKMKPRRYCIDKKYASHRV